MLQDKAFDSIFEDLLSSYKDYIPEESTERILVPTVIACLGGAGGMIGAKLKSKLKEYYLQAGNDLSENPLDLFSFTLFDTVNYNKIEPEVRESFPITDYCYLGGFVPETELKYHGTSDLLEWWDNDYKVSNREITDGASRVRQLGRLCLYVHRGKAYEKLFRSVRSVNELNRKLVESGKAKAGGGMQVRLYVISGTCGGTGSGTFIDISHLMLKAAADCGAPSASLNGVLLMPQLYVQKLSLIDESLVTPLKANAYALFKEIQALQYNNKDRVGTSSLYEKFSFDAIENKNGAYPKPYVDSRVWSRLFLIDNIVGSSKMINNIPDLCELAAESLFHYLVLPTGFRDETDETNSARLNGITKYGLPTAFSSIGFSQLVYPAKQLVKFTLAKYMSELLGRLLHYEDGSEETNKMVERLKINDSLGIAFWDQSLNFEALTRQLSDLEAIRKSFGKAEESQNEIATAQNLITGTLDSGRKNIDQCYSNADARLQDAIRIITDEISNLSAGSSLALSMAAVSKHLSWLEGQKEQMRVAEAFDYTKIERVFSDITGIVNSVGFFNKAKKRAQLNIALDAARVNQGVYLRKALQLYSDHKKAEYAGRLIEGISRILDDARVLKSKLEDLTESFRAYASQPDYSGKIPATTTYIPEGCPTDRTPQVDDCVKSMIKNIDEDINEYIVQRTRIMELVKGKEIEESRIQKFIKDMLSNVINSETALKDEILSKTVLEVANTKWTEEVERDEVFVNRIQQNLYELAAPTIRLNWGLASTREIQTKDYAAGPKNDKMENISSKITKEAYSTMDRRRISFLRVLHGFSVNAIEYFQQYKSAYMDVIRRLSAKGTMDQELIFPHISKTFNKNVDLPEVVPALRDFGEQKISLFTQAFFTHWLAIIRGEGQYRCIYRLEGDKTKQPIPVAHEGGVITQKGNNFYAYLLEKVTFDGTDILIIKDERKLRTNLTVGEKTVREEAKDSCDTRELEEALELYWKQYFKKHSYEQADVEMQEYLNYLTSLSLDKKESRSLRDQYEAERKAFEHFMNTIPGKR